MVRKVFDNGQCAHVWAQQTQDSGRSANGNLYFEGPTIYSYRTNWPLATFTTSPNGKKVVLVNIEKYSISTSGHLCDVTHALDGLSVTRVDISRDELVEYLTYRQKFNEATDQWEVRRSVDFDDIMEFQRDAIVASMKSYCNPRKVMYGIDDYEYGSATKPKPSDASNRIEAMNKRYELLRVQCNQLGVKVPDFDVTTATQQINDAFDAYFSTAQVAKRNVAALRRAKKAPIERLRRLVDEYNCNVHNSPGLSVIARLESAFEAAVAHCPMDQWVPFVEKISKARAISEMNYNDVAFGYINYHRQYKLYEYCTRRNPVTPEQWLDGKAGSFYQDAPTLCRKRGDDLETSRGAHAPWKEAVLIYHRAVKARREHKPFRPNGERLKIGYFELSYITAEGDIQIGCHSIKFEEMERLACREGTAVATYPVPACV